MNTVNRRRFERFAVSPMYTDVKVCSLELVLPTYEGHAYDVSEGGVQFELDSMLPTGTPVAMELTFPGSAFDEIDPRANTVVVVGNIVWADGSEPGPVRMAVAITRFARETDRERLLKNLSKGRISRAA